MNDYETLARERMEEFRRYAAHEALVKQAEQARRAKRNQYAVITHFVRFVSAVLASLR